MADRAFSVLGVFLTAQELVEAIPEVRARDLGRLEAYSPYPIHGIDRALGLRRSPLGGMVLVMGLLGAATAILFQWWTSAVDYPVITGGKTPFSWQAFVPILFEITVLFATFTAGLGMVLLLNRLPSFAHPVLGSKAISGITRDRFALAIESAAAAGPNGGSQAGLDVEAAREALLAAGAESVEVLHLPARHGPYSPRLLLRSAVGIGLACVVAGCGTYWGVKLFPVLPPMVHMQVQPRLGVQRESPFFADGSGMRMPVEGTVARGHLPYLEKTQDEAVNLMNPLPRTRQVLEMGKRAYENHCIVCHGVLGDGTPTLTSAYGAKPGNLTTDAVRAYPDGKIYHVIMAGKNAMSSYAADLEEDERWAVVHYVRVLDRSQNAHEEDVR